MRGSHHARKLTAESELQPNLLRKTEDFEGRKRKGAGQNRCTSVRKIFPYKGSEITLIYMSVAYVTQTCWL